MLRWKNNIFKEKICFKSYIDLHNLQSLSLKTHYILTDLKSHWLHHASLGAVKLCHVHTQRNCERGAEVQHAVMLVLFAEH